MPSSICMVYVLVTFHVCCVTSHTLYDFEANRGTRFNYDTNPNDPLGVYNWPRTHQTSCGGFDQSPINIRSELVHYGAIRRHLRMLSLHKIVRGTLKNNGHSASFQLDDPMTIKLTDIPHRPGVYYLHDFHFHYGGHNGRNFEREGNVFRGKGYTAAGSEHMVDGERFEGEVHFVFYNSIYRDIEEADDKTDGLVVVALFVQKRPLPKLDNAEMYGFSDFLLSNMHTVYNTNQNSSTVVDMSMFFNEQRVHEFYTYEGSTTTPRCHESVRWILLRKPIHVTEIAWFQLTIIKSFGDFDAQVGNYRTSQPLHGRVVEANFVPAAPTIRTITAIQRRMTANYWRTSYI